MLIHRVARKIREVGVLGTIKLLPNRMQQYYQDYLWDKEEVSFDRTHQIDTQYFKAEKPEFDPPQSEYNEYGPIRVSIFQRAVRALPIRLEEFVFIDFGSGKGRALLMASHFPFKKIIGVELTPQLNEIAHKNIQLYRNKQQKCSNIESICAEASVFAIPDKKAVFFFYNPFDESVMRKVLANIEESLERCQREIFIIYANPVCRELMENTKFLKQIKEERGHPEFMGYIIYASH